jgi:hypothetical protein
MAFRDSAGRKFPEGYFEQLRELAADNVAGSTKLFAHFNDFVRDAARTAEARRAGDSETDPATLLTRWLDFNLASYSVVSSHSLALANELISAAERTLLPKAPPAAESQSETAARLELRLSGQPGERVSSGFMVENNFDRPFAVTLECDDLKPSNGPALPASSVAFEPATLLIPPNGQGVVQASVSITADFLVGETYTTTIRLLGLQARQVGLAVRVLPAADKAEPVNEPAVEGTQAKKKRRPA